MNLDFINALSHELGSQRGRTREKTREDFGSPSIAEGILALLQAEIAKMAIPMASSNYFN
jgi:hypothetical protein